MPKLKYVHFQHIKHINLIQGSTAQVDKILRFKFVVYKNKKEKKEHSDKICCFLNHMHYMM